MSADAKIWPDGQEGSYYWNGTHDGYCRLCERCKTLGGAENFFCQHEGVHRNDGLDHIIRDITDCLGYWPIYWEIRNYPNGQGSGLAGYITK